MLGHLGERLHHPLHVLGHTPRQIGASHAHHLDSRNVLDLVIVHELVAKVDELLFGLARVIHVTTIEALCRVDARVHPHDEFGRRVLCLVDQGQNLVLVTNGLKHSTLPIAIRKPVYLTGQRTELSTVLILYAT